MRIVYCYNTLWKTGGIETITAIKANALSRLEGNDVWVVVTDSPDHAPDVLSPNVHLVDLGIHYDKISWRFPLNLIQLLPKRCLHRKKLRRLFHEIHPDVVISAGGHERKILPFLLGPWVLIRECHTITNNHQTSQDNLVKTTRWLGEMIEFRLFSKRYDRIVVLTEEDKRINWHNNDRVIVLENPLRFSLVKLSSLTKKKVISVGRLSPVKGFSQLIRAFKTVVDLYPDWELHIFGEGPERESLLDEIQSLGLQNSVSLHGTTKQVQEELTQASIYACSSRFEGFGLSILEAMSCGLPIVSFDCPYGPRSLIDNGHSGFLVPLDDVQGLSEKICLLIEDANLRKTMGENAYNSTKKNNLDLVTSRWMDLFLELLSKKK